MPSKKVLPKVNHVILAVDVSGSMETHANILDKLVHKLTSAVVGLPGKTLITLYAFNHKVSLLASEIPAGSPVPRLPYPGGWTALMDATGLAIQNALTRKAADKLKSKNEDHSWLLYVVTDGGESGHSSVYKAESLQALVEGLDDTWTVATMVPNLTAKHHAMRFGIPAGNIEIWDTTSAHGYETAGDTIAASVASYSALRVSGATSTRSLFKTDLSNVTKADVKAELQKVDGRIYVAQKEYQIRDFVEKMTNKTYVKGAAFYELVKPEVIQAQKEIVIVPVKNKDGVKYGGKSARQMLGLPDHELKVAPGTHGDWRIFVQSTSVNRKLVAGTAVFVKE